jgi:hypothetical protein
MTLSLNRVCQMKKNAALDENQIWGARLGRIFCAGAPKCTEGPIIAEAAPLDRRVEML